MKVFERKLREDQYFRPKFNLDPWDWCFGKWSFLIKQNCTVCHNAGRSCTFAPHGPCCFFFQLILHSEGGRITWDVLRFFFGTCSFILCWTCGEEIPTAHVPITVSQKLSGFADICLGPKLWVFLSYGWWFRNPANQLIWAISHYLQGFIDPRWLFGISSINSTGRTWAVTSFGLLPGRWPTGT